MELGWRYFRQFSGLGVLMLAGVMLSSLDPTREAGITDAVWVLFGWAGGLLYCLPIYLAKFAVPEALAFYADENGCTQPSLVVE